MTYGSEQRIEQLERAVHTLAAALALVVKDRQTVAKLTKIAVRYDPPVGSMRDVDTD